MAGKKLRIVLSSDSYPPYISGVAVFTQRLAKGLMAEGHEVLVIASSLTGAPSREIINGVTVHRFRSVRSPWRKGFRHVAGQALSVNRVLKEFKPDIIHGQDPMGCSSGALRYALKNGIPVLGTYHFSMKLVMAYIPFAEYFPEGAKTLIAAYVNEFFNQCDVVTCPTETVKQDLLDQGVVRPVVAISNGIDEHSAIGALSPRQPADVINLLCVGRVDEDKNVPLLLRAVQELSATHAVKLKIVGDGAPLATYRRWVRDHNLEKVITFTGAMKSESPEWTAAYAEARIFVTPSLIETQGMVAMEAMLASLPVVAPHAGALPELIRDGETGILVKDITAHKLSAALASLIDNPERIPRMGAVGREVIKEHSFDAILERFQSLYIDLIDARFGL